MHEVHEEMRELEGALCHITFCRVFRNGIVCRVPTD